MINKYYRLTKPGIIYGNSVNTIAGFLLASVASWSFGGWLLAATVLGTALIIGSGCVFNNYLDRGLDRKMTRTKKRALANGTVSGRSALVYGFTLGFAGFAMLGLFTNWLVVAAGVVGIVDYVWLYGYFKRRSAYGTLVGSVAGAMPPLAGYCAVTGVLDSGAWLLFLLLVAWQMPHFYSIAMYRQKDYAAAGLPVLPLSKGVFRTKVESAAFIVLFTASALLLTVFGYTGWVYFVVMAALGVAWLWVTIAGFNVSDNHAWARKMFGFSLVVTLVVAVMLPLGAWLP